MEKKENKENKKKIKKKRRKPITLRGIVLNVIRLVAVALIGVGIFYIVILGMVMYELKTNGFTMVCALYLETDSVRETVNEQFGITEEQVAKYEKGISDVDRERMNGIVAKAVECVSISDLNDKEKMDSKLKDNLTEEEWEYLEGQIEILKGM